MIIVFYFLQRYTNLNLYWNEILKITTRVFIHSASIYLACTVCQLLSHLGRKKEGVTQLFLLSESPPALRSCLPGTAAQPVTPKRIFPMPRLCLSPHSSEVCFPFFLFFLCIFLKIIILIIKVIHACCKNSNNTELSTMKRRQNLAQTPGSKTQVKQGFNVLAEVYQKMSPVMWGVAR